MPQSLLVSIQVAREKLIPVPEGKGKKHHKNGKCRKQSRFKQKHVFALGLFRGATPCLKLMILAPLLIVVNIWLAIAMVLVYAASSTIYPVMGFLLGSLLRKPKRYHKHLRVAGALILITIGVYSIINGLVVADHV